MAYKIIEIGRSRERPTVFIILSSLYSVQLYLVWSQKLHQNALLRAILNAKMRTQIHAHAQVYCDFHFLSLFSTHYLFPFLFISLACAISFLSFWRITFIHAYTFFSQHTLTLTLSLSLANLIGCTCAHWCKIKPITHRLT